MNVKPLFDILLRVLRPLAVFYIEHADGAEMRPLMLAYFRRQLTDPVRDRVNDATDQGPIVLPYVLFQPPKGPPICGYCGHYSALHTIPPEGCRVVEESGRQCYCQWDGQTPQT